MSRHNVRLADRDVVVTVDDEHLLAHADDFDIPIPELLPRVAQELDRGTLGPVSASFDLGAVVGA
jgi:hypothetical protein